MTREMLSTKGRLTVAALVLLFAVVALALCATSGVASEKATGADVKPDAVEVAADEADVPASVKPEALVEKSAEELANIEAANAVCAACHTDEGASMGIGATEEEPADEAEPAEEAAAEGAEDADVEPSVCLAAVHATAGIACTDCHVDAEKLDTIHANLGTKKPASRLRQTKVLDDVCLTCHVDRETLAELTSDVYMEDEKGTQVNPHALPEGVKDHDSMECRDCHVAHKAVQVVTDSNGTCLSCHHSGVFECGTCH